MMITIIIPIYKMEKHLKKCLENIVSQSYKDWQIIIVNDGSDSPSEIESIANDTLDTHQFQIIHQHNKGLSGARNTGIKAANTKYVMSLDPDDELHVDFLYEVMKAFEKSNADIVHYWTQFQGASNFILKTKTISFFNLLRGNLITSATPFRKKVWETIGGFDESMRNGHEDWEFWIRSYLSEFTFYGINKVLFFYNVLDGGMNTNATIMRANNIHYIRTKHKNIYNTSLYSLYKNPLLKEASKSSLIWFWLTNLFFIYLPKSTRNYIFEIYRTHI